MDDHRQILRWGASTAWKDNVASGHEDAGRFEIEVGRGLHILTFRFDAPAQAAEYERAKRALDKAFDMGRADAKREILAILGAEPRR